MAEPIGVFVVGCPRSGTTLVGEVMARHSQAFSCEETYFIYLFADWLQMLKRPHAPLTARFLDNAESMIRQTVTEAARAEGKIRFVDHTPWHCLFLPEVRRLFPSAFVIHVVRDPVDVVDSLRRSYRAGYKWAGRTVRERFDLWSRCVMEARRWDMSPTFLQVRYEELVAAPERIARGMLEFVELGWEPTVLEGFTILHAGATSTRRPIGTIVDGRLQFSVDLPSGSKRRRDSMRRTLQSLDTSGLVEELGY